MFGKEDVIEPELWQVKAPHFTAGLVVRDNKIIEAAPILKGFRHMSFPRFLQYCRTRRGWSVERVPPSAA